MAKNKQQAERDSELRTPAPPVPVKTIKYRPVPKFGACPDCLKNNPTT